MSKDFAKLSRLIEDIYATPIEQRGWDGMVGLIAKAFDSHSCALALLDTDAGQAIPLGFTTNYTPDMVVSYEAHYYKTDLWAQSIPLDGFGKIFVSDDVIARRELTGTEFYNDWVKQIGIADVMGTILPLSQNLRGVFGVHRAEGEKEFGEKDKTLLQFCYSAFNASHSSFKSAERSLFPTKCGVRRISKRQYRHNCR